MGIVGMKGSKNGYDDEPGGHEGWKEEDSPTRGKKGIEVQKQPR